MQRTLTALLLFLFTLPAWSQSIPGTFTRTQPRRDIDLYSIPLITTPQISFGSALTPPVLSIGQEVVVSTPTGTYDPSLLTQQSDTASEDSETAYWPQRRMRPVRMARFDYVVAPTEGVNPGESGGESLGATADSMRKGPPPTQTHIPIRTSIASTSPLRAISHRPPRSPSRNPRHRHRMSNRKGNSCSRTSIRPSLRN